MRKSRTAITALVFVLGAVTAAHAGANSNSKKGQGNASSSTTDTSAPVNPTGTTSQLTVLSATLDRAQELLVLEGMNFGGGTPTVLCGTYEMTVVSATDSQLVVIFPASIPDGTYLFTVSRGSSQ